MLRDCFKRRSTSSEPAAEPTLRTAELCDRESQPAAECNLARTTGHERQQASETAYLDDVLQRRCSEEHLADIATNVTEWRELSPFLGLTEAEEHEILGTAPHSVRSQKIAMLRQWKKKKGKDATYNQLMPNV